MHQGDFESFSSMLRQLSEAFGKKLTDELIQAYWKALKDLPLGTVSRTADSHTRYGKFFPKPVELRPKDAPQETKPDPFAEAALARTIANWDERFEQAPERSRRMLLAAYVARIEVTERFGSDAYEERMARARAFGEHIRIRDYADEDTHSRFTVNRLYGS